MVIETIFNVILIGGLFAFPVFAAIRLFRVRKDLRVDNLRPRNALCKVLGDLTGLFLTGSLLVLAGTIVITFSFMKAGAASGIPIGLALFVIPWIWLLSEFLFGLCYTRTQVANRSLEIDETGKATRDKG